MSNYLEFECTPSGESCAQVGQEHYYEVGRIEATVLIEQLKEQFGDTFSASIRSMPHDFGSYYEIRIKESNIAYEIDANFPEYWTKKSKEMLDELLDYGFEEEDVRLFALQNIRQTQ